MGHQSGTQPIYPLRAMSVVPQSPQSPQSPTSPSVSSSDYEDDANSPSSLPVRLVLPRRVGKSKRPPVHTVIATLATWGFYFYGICFMIGWGQADLSLDQPVSPPASEMYLYTISSWPDCADLRHDYSRLISFQFVHAGAMHLIGNSLGLLSYGSLFEMYNPGGLLATAAIYQLSVVFGGLGHSFLWPYRGLIGCSPGVYGLIGACWTLAFFDKKRLDPFVAFALPIILLFQLGGDIVSYVLFYSSGTGYSSHFFGFTTGLLAALGLKLFSDSNLVRCAAVAAILALFLQSGFLLYEYTRTGTPNIFTESFIHNSAQAHTCCADLFEFASDNGISLKAAQNETYCNNDNLYSIPL